MQEAIDRDLLISFIGKPKRIDDRGSQVGKALKEIRAEDYYQAERKGFVLYLEGSTDIAILRGWAKLLSHQALEKLNEPFVHYVANQPKKVEAHFFGVREAKADLKAFALFDRLQNPLPIGFNIQAHVWSRREIENYLNLPETLMRYAADVQGDDLVSRAEKDQRLNAMKEAITEVQGALETLGRDPWSSETKVSDDVLQPIFDRFYKKLKLSNRINKSDFHILVDYMAGSEVDKEIIAVLDAIAAL